MAVARRTDRGRPGPLPGPPGLAARTGPGLVPARFRTDSLPEEASGPPLSGFLEIVGPLISQGRDRLREGIEVLGREHGELPFDRSTVERALYEACPSA